MTRPPSKAQQAAAFSLAGWMQYPTSIQVDVDNEEDFKAISEMMRSKSKPNNGIGFWGRDVERYDGGLKPGKYTVLHQEKVFFTVYWAKVV